MMTTPAEFYVSPDGSDTNPGRKEQPFATLERARDAVRKAAPEQPRKVIVRQGAYRLTKSFALGKEDSGTADHPAVWQAAPGELVRLTGGQTIPAAAFLAVTDEKSLARLDPAARGKVLQVDLGALGIRDLGGFPGRFRGAPAVPELFFHDQRMTLARWPNEGWTTIAKLIDEGSRPDAGDKSGRGGIFEYSGDRPDRWDIDAGVWLRGYWCFDWSDESIRIKTVDHATHQITMAEPHIYGLRQGNLPPRRYYAFNLLEELDQPGEYFIDHNRGILYFWPPAAIDNASAVLSTLGSPVVAIQDADHVVLRGFTVEATRADGITVRGGQGVRIQSCLVRNTRELGIRVTGGASHKIEACDIHDTGIGGLSLEGGDRKTLTSAGHEAINNHIWRFSEHQFTYASGMRLAGVGNRAAHNLIHDAPHMAVGIEGNDHVFEFNVVHNVCTETDDAGALYKGRNPSCRGNVIRYNFWHHIGNPMGHGNAAVYFDDGDGGDSVMGNIFFRCGEPGRGPFGSVFSHGGHDLLAENNVFIECRRAIGSAPWDDTLWAKALRGEDGHFWPKLLLEDVDITTPPYTTRYPALVGFMDAKPGQPRVSHAARNVFVMCGEVSGGNWQWDAKNNLVIDKDPGFVNAAGGDFRLRPDSQVAKAMPEFKPIPFQKMGLYADELRPKLVPEPWTYPPPAPAPAPAPIRL